MTELAQITATEGPAAGAGAGAPSPRPRGVLVVDDNDDIRTLLAIVARRYGFAVWLAAGGREGVTCYREHGPEIDVVLLDVRMPDGDGPEALAAIRAAGTNVPCCFMSGESGYYTEEDLLALGAARVFLKPFRLPEVIEQLQKLAAPPAPDHRPRTTGGADDNPT